MILSPSEPYRSFPPHPPGHSSLFPMEDERTFGEEESGDQALSGLGPAHCFPHLNGERVERYSRKVFVGGLPPDIDEGTAHLWNTRDYVRGWKVLTCCTHIRIMCYQNVILAFSFNIG